MGLAAIIATSATLLTFIKWAGVAYLIWLGFRMIRRANATDPALGQRARPVSIRTLWLQGFLTSAANPKAVVFFAALFSQFIDGAEPFWPQFLILSVTYIVIDGCFLSGYGLTASWIAKRFRGTAKAWVETAGGAFMILAAILLGLRTIARS